MAEPFRIAGAGSWEHDGSPWQRRVAISAAVAALHLTMLIALLVAQALTRRPLAPASPDVIWMMLEEEAAEPIIVEPLSPPPVPVPLSEPAPEVAPEVAPQVPPAVAVPAQPSPAPITAAPAAPMTTGKNPAMDRKALDALRPFVLCGVPTDGRPLPENTKPCETVHWGLATRPTAQRPTPTEAELALKREFERAYAVETSPVLLPCAAGLMLDPLCLVGGMLNGFDFKMGSYAGMVDGQDCGFGEGGGRLCGTASSKPTVGGLLGR